MAKIIIYSWPGADGVATISPFCLKPMIAARAKGLVYETEYVMRTPVWVTTKKLPAAMIDNNQVTDSTNIMKVLDTLPSEKPALYPSDPALKAEVILLEDWADESLFWYLLEYRWKIESNYNEFSKMAFSKLKFPLRQLIPRMIRKEVTKRLKAQGLGSLSARDRDINFKEISNALDQRLMGRSYFVGSHLTAADVAIYAQLKQIASTKLAPAYSIMSECNNLMAFMERMEQV